MRVFYRKYKEIIFYPLVIAFLLATIFSSYSLNRSFWLDETYAGWLVSENSIYKVFLYSLYNLNQSPLYFLFLKCFINSNSEFYLRLPSLLCFFISGILIFYIVKKIIDTETAFIGVILFLLRDGIVEAAYNAKVYSIALLFVILSCFFLLKWLTSLKTRYSLFWCLTLLLASYFHYTYLAVLFFQFIFIFSSNKLTKAIIIKEIPIFTLLILGLIPIFIHYQYCQENMLQIAYAPVPTLQQALKIFSPKLLLIMLFICTSPFLFTRKLSLVFPKNLNSDNIKRYALPLIICWCGPFLSIFCYAKFSGISYFQTRYILWDVLAWILLFGIFIRSISPIKARVFFILVLTCFGFYEFHHNLTWLPEDWRQTVKKVSEISLRDTPILIYSGFVEGENVKWLRDKRHTPYILSPFSYYLKKQRNLIAIPPHFESNEYKDYFNHIEEKVISKSNKIYLVVRKQELATHRGAPNSFIFINEYMEDFFKKHGWDILDITIGGRVKLYELKRPYYNPPL